VRRIQYFPLQPLRAAFQQFLVPITPPSILHPQYPPWLLPQPCSRLGSHVIWPILWVRRRVLHSSKHAFSFTQPSLVRRRRRLRLITTFILQRLARKIPDWQCIAVCARMHSLLLANYPGCRISLLRLQPSSQWHGFFHTINPGDGMLHDPVVRHRIFSCVRRRLRCRWRLQVCFSSRRSSWTCGHYSGYSLQRISTHFLCNGLRYRCWRCRWARKGCSVDTLYLCKSSLARPQ